jgi:alpha-N-arabinofuranosidase
MTTRISRRQFARTGAVASLAALLPRNVFSQGSAATKNAVVRADETIGMVKPEFHGNFAEHLGSCVYGGMWVGPKSPIPNIEGFRKDTVDALKELGVPVLRWPGGCFADDYHWRDGVGPREKRPKRVNTVWGGYTEDNSFGTHEFMRFCQLIGAEAYLAANVGSGSPQEMREWMEYCNYPGGSSLSDERAANGSKEPFKVRYWGVGNELWGCGGNYTPQNAAIEFRHFATFARQFGDTRMYLVGCGPSGDDVRWTRGFMDTLQASGGPQPNGYSMHYYEGGSLMPTQFTKEAMYTQFNLFPRVERAVAHQRALLDDYDPGRRIGLILDEWGVWDQMSRDEEQKNGRLWQQASICSAVAAGLGLNIFNRLADKLYMCNIAQMVNVLQSLLLTDGPEGAHCVRTANYHAFMLFKPHRGKTSVRVEADGMTLAIPQGGRGGRGGPGQQEPAPEISISASKSATELLVSLVNPRADQDWTVDVSLRGASAKSGSAQILHDSDMNAANSFDQPNRLAIKPHDVAVNGDSFRVVLPAMSVATVVLKTA